MMSLKEQIAADSGLPDIIASRVVEEVSRRKFIKMMGVCLVTSAATVTVSEAAEIRQPDGQDLSGCFPWMGP